VKISLAGPYYTSASVDAAAHRTMNLVPGPIEVPNEPTRMALYGRPGLKLFGSVSPGKFRALWAGGGKLFAVVNNNWFQVDSAGTFTLLTGHIAESAGTPWPDAAQIFSNGHQLMIVGGGNVYYDNGAGAVQAKFAIAGHGNTFNSPGSLVRTDGPSFVSGWAGQPIMIDDIWYTISGVPNANTILLNPPLPPDATYVIWQIAQGANVDGVTGGFLDGYGVVNRVPTPGVANDPGREFFISALNDFSMWQSLDFGVKEGHSDYIRSVLCANEELWLFGTETVEIWTNTGDPNFPFQRIQGAFIPQGSVATFAPCIVGLSVCWLAGGADGQTVAMQARGLQPQRISTYAQESAWNAPGFKVSDAVSYAYSDGGHTYWVINFYQQAVTWVYDTTTGLWHERAAWDNVGLNFLRYRPWYHVFVPEWGTGGKHIVGDPNTGKLYEQSLNYYSDDGDWIEYIRAMPHLIAENQYGYHHRIEVLLEQGAQGSTDPLPAIGLDWSDDHGHTFAHNRYATAAATGDYTKRVAWRRLGKARDRVYRFGMTSKTKVAIIDAYLEMTQGFA